MRVGLVIGGGGVQGAVWAEGALASLAEETGWNPADAEVIVGTSAGAWAATMLAAGVPPWLMAAQSAGENIPDLLPGPGLTGPPPTSTAPRRRHIVGSPSLLLRSLLRPTRPSALSRAVLASLPRGRHNSRVEELVRLIVPTGWPAHPNLWCVACDYRTGKRVVFSRAWGDEPDAAKAVAASCAVPGFFEPVTIGSREYVDGGLHSVSNLDVVANCGLDLVICLNPMSSLDSIARYTPLDLAWKRVRRLTGRRLGSEARLVRQGGTPVLLLQPTARDIRVLGFNWLLPSRHSEIIAVTRETVARQLDESPLAPLLQQLPAGLEHQIRRPTGPTSQWPDFVAAPAWGAASRREFKRAPTAQPAPRTDPAA